MLENKVNGVIQSLSPIGEEIHATDSLSDDLGFDSLRIVELIVALEDAFQIEIDESDLDPESIVTVADLYNLMGKYAEEAKCCMNI